MVDYFLQFPINSNIRFGNEIEANLGGSAARLSGNNPFAVNRSIALNGPNPLDIQAALYPAYSMEQFGIATAPAAPAAQESASDRPLVTGLFGTGADNRLSWFMKNLNVAILAVVILALGLFWFVKSSAASAVGDTVKEVIGE